MMEYVFSPIWAALQIGFAFLFLSSFLEIKRRREEVAWIAVVAWLLTAIYGLLKVEGIHGYLLYLLSAVVLLLASLGTTARPLRVKPVSDTSEPQAKV